MRLDDLLPPKDDPRVISFCEGIRSGGRPFYVDLKPEPYSRALRCFQNVEAKIQRDTGEIVFGWEITWIPKVYLEGQFHAVWRSPSGIHADVTPQPVPHPSIQQPTRILFLSDRDHRDSRPTVPPHRAALGDPKLVERYWHLADEGIEIESQMSLAGFSYQAFVQRTQAARDERQSILERLRCAV